jgi:hypothetical protein
MSRLSISRSGMRSKPSLPATPPSAAILEKLCSQASSLACCLMVRQSDDAEPCSQEGHALPLLCLAPAHHQGSDRQTPRTTVIVGTRAMLQWPRSPRSHPKNPRLSNSVSSRSVFARRCSRDTATLEGWITCASTPRALSDRANQKPSRPASKASAICVISLPALTASSRQRCSRPVSLSALGRSFSLRLAGADENS